MTQVQMPFLRCYLLSRYNYFLRFSDRPNCIVPRSLLTVNVRSGLSVILEELL
jgi:hypothetical protein